MSAWRDRAACRGKPTALWFAFPRTPEFQQAAEICAECPVRTECEQTGKAGKEVGRWGAYVNWKDRPRRFPPVEFRCERCGIPVLLEHHSGQLHRCVDCLWEDPDTRNVATKRVSRLRVARRELERQVERFERDIAEFEREAAS